MAWRWPGDKALSELMMVSLLVHVCITRPNELIHNLFSEVTLLKLLPHFPVNQDRWALSHLNHQTVYGIRTCLVGWWFNLERHGWLVQSGQQVSVPGAASTLDCLPNYSDKRVKIWRQHCSDRWPMNSPHKGPVTWKIFHLMTSSWEYTSLPTCDTVITEWWRCTFMLNIKLWKSTWLCRQ